MNVSILLTTFARKQIHRIYRHSETIHNLTLTHDKSALSYVNTEVSNDMSPASRETEAT
jgi:hypothetical protein